MVNNIKANHNSLWLETVDKLSHSTLDKDIETDILIIGGGIAGLTTAYLLTKSNLSVTLIDSHEIISGVSGHTTAKITALHPLIYTYLNDTFSKQIAKTYADANQSAINKIREIVKNENIECDLEDEIMYLYCSNIEDINKIEKEAKILQDIGLAAQLHTNLHIPVDAKLTMSLNNQAQFHPAKYLKALSTLVTLRSGKIYDHTTALDIETGDVCIVKTSNGNIKAKNVIITTHYPFYDWHGKYFARMYPQRAYAIAVKLNTPIISGMYTDISAEEYSIRSYKDLLIVSGQGHRTGEGENMKENYERLVAYTNNTFDVKNIEYYWSTQDNYTVDRIPYIGNLTSDISNIYVATGFNGWGMSSGTLSGIIISDLILEKENSWKPLFAPSRFDPLASANKFIGHNLEVAKRYVSDKLHKENEDFSDLRPNEGRIIKHKGEKVGVYKDTEGKIHGVSTKCTHMGCEVHWNNAENSWDCPCHGSRFNFDGKVIHGPATKGLEEKDVSSE